MKSARFSFRHSLAGFLYVSAFTALLLIFSGNSSAQCSVTVTAPNGTSFCQGQSANLVAHAVPSAGTGYQWFLTNNNGTIWTPISGATDSIYTCSINACVKVVVSNGSCTASSSQLCITANPLPSGTVSSSAPSGTCSGNSITLCAPGGALYVYQWLLNNANIAGATGACFNPMIAGNYSLHLVNLQGCDTMLSAPPVVFFPIPDTPTVSINSPVCPGDTAFLSAQCNTVGVSYTWSGPNGFTSTQQNPVRPNADTTMTGNYVVMATTTNGCSNTSLPATLALGCQDSVWPGDANYDYVVDNNDIFELAAAWNTTGPVRNNASNNWVGQYCTNWPSSNYSGVNRKHADCNGDGTVDYGDTVAISQNYSLTHLRPSGSALARQTGVPDLYFDLTGINFAPGAIVQVPLKFGTATIPVIKAWGIAGRLNIAGTVPATVPSFDFSTGWMSGSNNMLPFTKAVATDKVDWALARTDHHNMSGSGTIGIVSFRIPSNAVSGQQLSLSLTDVRLLDSSGNDLTTFNVVNDTATIVTTGITGLQMPEEVLIFPNPSTDRILIDYKKEGLLELSDITGKVMKTAMLPEGASQQMIVVSELPAGLYYYRYLVNGSTVQIGKLVVVK